jgi:hypothetical protein
MVLVAAQFTTISRTVAENSVRVSVMLRTLVRSIDDVTQWTLRRQSQITTARPQVLMERLLREESFMKRFWSSFVLLRFLRLSRFTVF